MTNEEIISKANTIVVDHLLGTERELRRDESFIDDLGADSLDAVELIMELEDAFSITFTDDEAEQVAVNTVGHMHDILIEKLGGDNG